MEKEFYYKRMVPASKVFIMRVKRQAKDGLSLLVALLILVIFTKVKLKDMDSKLIQTEHGMKGNGEIVKKRELEP